LFLIKESWNESYNITELNHCEIYDRFIDNFIEKNKCLLSEEIQKKLTAHFENLKDSFNDFVSNVAFHNHEYKKTKN